MKSAKMKSSITKYFLIAVLAISNFAVNATGKDTTSVATKKSAKVFSQEEKAFFQEIETFYQETLYQMRLDANAATVQQLEQQCNK